MADFSKTFTDETEELYNSPTPWSPFPIPENLIFSRANENQLEPSHQVKNIETYIAKSGMVLTGSSHLPAAQ